MTTHISAVVVRSKEDGVPAVLLLRRVEDEKWCLPGGKAELHETSMTTAVREMWEETHIYATLELDRMDWRRYNNIPIHLFRTKNDLPYKSTPTLQRSEHSEFIWADAEWLLKNQDKLMDPLKDLLGFL